MRCHLGVVPQERTAEEHTTRGLPTIRAIFGRGTLGAMVSRGWSLWTVQCEGEMYPARTLTTSASQQRLSTNCWPGSMAGERVDPSVPDCCASQIRIARRRAEEEGGDTLFVPE